MINETSDRSCSLDSDNEQVKALDCEEASDQGSGTEEDAKEPAVERGPYQKKKDKMYGGKPVMTK